MKDNVEKSASMGVPSSAAVEADPDEVAEGGVSGGGVVEVRVLTHLVFESKTRSIACLAELSTLSSYIGAVKIDGDLAIGNHAVAVVDCQKSVR